MRILTLALLLALALPARAQVSPGGHVLSIDSTDVARSGARRVSDVLALTGAHLGTSLDGFRHGWDAAALAGSGFPNYRVRVDGLPIRIGQPFDVHPELIPVSPDWIRRVTVGMSPSIGPGGLAAGGWIDIETTPPPEGLSVSGFVSAGNEVGDPGPFRYTPEATPNADRIGPAYGIRGSVRAGAWWIDAALRGDEIHMTDPLLAERVSLLYRGYRRPRLLLAAPELSVQYRGARARHRFSFGFSALRDLRFLNETGVEVPSLSRQWSFGATGNAPLAPGSRFYYVFEGRQQDMLPRTRDQQVGFDQVASRLDAEIGAERSSSGGSAGMAVGGRGFWLSSEPPIRERDAASVWARGHLELRPVSWWTHRMTLQADGPARYSSGDGRIGVSGTWEHRLGRPGGSSFDLSVALLTVRPESGDEPWFWMLRGWVPPAYEGEGVPDRVLTVAPILTDGRTGTLDAGWTIRRPHTAVTVSAFGRLFRGLSLSSYRLWPDTIGDPWYRVDAHVPTGVSGMVVGGRLMVEVHGSASTRSRLVVTGQRYASYDGDAFGEVWSTRPAVEAAWFLSSEPVRRVFLHVSLRFRSKTTWPGVRTADGAPVELPSRFDGAVTMSKRFWSRRIRAFLTLDHLFDRAIRLHPLGQSDRLTLHVGASARFGFVPQG